MLLALLFAADATDFITVWSNYGGLGLVAGLLLMSLLWFMRHVVTVMIPKIIDTHAATVDKMVTTNAQTSKEIAANFTNEQKEARAMFLSLLNEERMATERRHVENRELHEQTLEGIQGNRHAVRDLNQSVVAHHAAVDTLTGIRRGEQPK
jgi:uncharacterized membrane protein YraQ (UPF0718 family)